LKPFARLCLGHIAAAGRALRLVTGESSQVAQTAQEECFSWSKRPLGSMPPAHPTQRLRIDPGNEIARTVANNLIDLQALSVAYWTDMSLRRYKRGDYAGGIDLARKALAIQPDSAVAYYNISSAYGRLKQWDLAVQAAEAALRLDPNFTEARHNLERLKLARGR
jgi:tetratricopeptide (TPR) repeat protein